MNERFAFQLPKKRGLPDLEKVGSVTSEDLLFLDFILPCVKEGIFYANQLRLPSEVYRRLDFLTKKERRASLLRLEAGGYIELISMSSRTPCYRIIKTP